MEPRNDKGQFTKGHSGNPAAQWPKGHSGNPTGLTFTAACQTTIAQYDLVETVAQIAAGVGDYAKAALNDRLRATEILFERGYGKVKPTTENTDEDHVVYVKRILGIDHSKI
jgi:hypothetical protein